MTAAEILATDDPVSEMIARLQHLSADEFTEAERVFEGAFFFLGDTLNGGLHQTFTNYTGEYMELMEKFVLSYCSPGFAEVLREVRSIFPNGYIPKDRGERYEIVESLDSDADPFDSVTDRFYTFESEAFDGLLKMIQCEIEEFGNIGNVGSSPPNK